MTPGSPKNQLWPVSLQFALQASEGARPGTHGQARGPARSGQARSGRPPRACNCGGLPRSGRYQYNRPSTKVKVQVPSFDYPVEGGSKKSRSSSARLKKVTQFGRRSDSSFSFVAREFVSHARPGPGRQACSAAVAQSTRHLFPAAPSATPDGRFEKRRAQFDQFKGLRHRRHQRR